MWKIWSIRITENKIMMLYTIFDEPVYIYKVLLGSSDKEQLFAFFSKISTKLPIWARMCVNKTIIIVFRWVGKKSSKEDHKFNDANLHKTGSFCSFFNISCLMFCSCESSYELLQSNEWPMLWERNSLKVYIRLRNTRCFVDM